MSEKTIAVKAKQVDKVAKLFQDSVASIIANSRGLTVSQSNDLRSQLKKEDVNLKVIKNTILIRAAKKVGYDNLDKVFKGPSAVAFSKKDIIAPERIIKKFSKTAEDLKLKGGIIDGKVTELDTINRYADIPSKETLLQQLIAELQSPLRSFMYGVNAIAKKEKNEQAEKADSSKK